MADTHALWMYPLLTLLGVAIGTYGSLIGAGGGIFLVPALLLLYPDDPPNTIASISLAVVFFNAVSGTIAYSRMRRIDYRAGLLFAAATVPGAVLGAFTTSLLSRRVFDLAFSALVLALATFIIVRSPAQRMDSLVRHGATTHTLIDFKGTNYSYTFSSRRGILISFAIGWISSVLGIGGGPFHVPVLVYLLHFPLHVATATSQFMLAIMSLFGSTAHLLAGGFAHGLRRTLFLSIGVLIGAQAGALFSQRLTGTVLIRVLAGGLLLIGIHLAMHAFER